MGDLGLEKVIILGTYLVFTAFVGVKWIRVAQREHYVFGWTERIAAGWGKSRPASLAPLLVSVLIGSALLVLGAYELVFEPVSALLAALAVGFAALWPWGLGFRGTTSKLQWTARAKRLAAIWFVVWVLSSIAGIALFAATLSATVFGVPLGGPGAAPVTAWLAGAFFVIALVAPARFAPISMDIALAIANPIEKALSKKWLVAAQKKLRQVNPTVVAVTGSYGKTST
jgi:UDP-N-acetylmuramoyl-tripeptide--D-alanyl-D-alanine ligase